MHEDTRIRRTALQEYRMLLDFANERGLPEFKSSDAGFPAYFDNLTNDFDSLEQGDAPKINLFGVIYPFLDKSKRAIVLKKGLEVLDGLDGSVLPDGVERVKGKDVVACIHEPWLIADIQGNRPGAYSPDLSGYLEKLKGGIWPEKFDEDFIISGGTGPRSIFWGVAYPLAITSAGYDLSLQRAQFVERFGGTGLVRRTHDAIASFIYESSCRDEIFKGIPKEKGIDDRIVLYAEDWREGIMAGMQRRNWVYLPETLERKTNATKQMPRPESNPETKA